MHCFRGWLAAVLFSVGLSALQAAPIAIVNPSFEDDPTETGTGNGIPTTGWTHSESLDFHNMGTYSATPTSFFDAANIPHGTGTAWMNSNGSMSQTLTATLIGGGSYTLSAYVGLRKSNGLVGHLYALQLWAGGVFLSEAAGQTVLADLGVFRQISLNYQAPAIVAPGQNLEIRLVHRSTGFYPQLAWDLVALDGPAPPAVPEPASMVFTGMGALCFACLSRRRYQGSAMRIQ